MGEIFISYARPDRDVARKLAAYLEDQGLSVWWDMSLKPGEVFREEIERRIRAARRVIVIWSETSVKSHFVLDEAGEARDQAKLIPLRIDNCVIPLGFRQHHTHDIRNWPADVAGVRAALGAGKTAAKSPPARSGDVKPSQQQKTSNAAEKHDANPRQAPLESKPKPIPTSASAEVFLSTIFVDFDNVYLSLRRKNEAAASRFGRNPQEWMAEIARGGLIRFKDNPRYAKRRFGVARCYGNPGGKLNPGGPNDSNAFAAVRTNFITAGFEVVDCKPLLPQFKNGIEFKIAFDIRDFLEHPTRFEEFIILPGSADFTLVLHYLQMHGRRTVVYTNENTADVYKGFSDGWIEERDLIAFLLR